MTEHEQIFALYASISSKTGERVEAAKASDWDRLIALEHDCHALIETLMQVDTGPHPGAGARFVQRKVAFIHKVLADDAEVRKFTEPWMTQLETFIGSARQERKLQRAYEADCSG